MVRSIIPSDLPNEYREALFKFYELNNNNVNVKGTSHPPKVDNDCWMNSNFCKIYSGKVKLANIPSGENWKWVQAKGRKTIPILNENMIVDIFKANPRLLSRDSPIPLPFLKIWIIHIKFGGNCNSIVWCEKGLDPTVHELEFIDSLLFSQ